MTTATTVLIVDDEPMVRAGLRAILSTEDGIEVVGEAGDGAEAVGLVRRHRPDVVLMDVRMPVVDGIAATRLLTGAESPPAVVVVTTFENDDYVYDALLAGARGFLLKRSPAEEIVAAVRTAATADALVFPGRLRALVESRAGSVVTPPVPGLDRLTAREGEVLRGMARGWSNAEIAAELFLGVETVKTHVRAVLTKMGARDRTQAVIGAYEAGFVTPGSSSEPGEGGTGR
ncbi:response regulator transcription factor [Nocardioides sp.]|uniref:response regulator transcription factor n=1 Tax=Nocardioides sp. TaxID=35761 RepID=UPI002734F222|nr:response regulator transcription factor [Nocardioides sp.]MDP3890340.1 response regulator transcription factor [Nocardioides sp.]